MQVDQFPISMVDNSPTPDQQQQQQSDPVYVRGKSQLPESRSAASLGALKKGSGSLGTSPPHATSPAAHQAGVHAQPHSGGS